MKRIIRVSTVPQSLNTFCRGMLKDLSQEYEVIAMSSPGTQLDEIAEREGVRTISIPMDRHISLFHDIKSLFSFIRVFRKEKPDMVHSITPKAGLFSMLAGWITHVPVRVHTFTGLVFPTSSGLKKRVLILTDKLTCACATNVIPEGEGVKNDLVKYHITSKPMNVLGYGNIRGVDMDYYKRTEDVSRCASSIRVNSLFTFLYVGRIVKDKGINELISAFTRLNDEFPHTRLLLVGEYEDNLDPISSESKKAIDKNPSIIAVGRKSGVEMLAYYASADCLVLPSYREGFPNTVLEAGAMGLPCVVTDINGSREIITDGYNGLIARPRDIESLLHAMRIMVSNDIARLHMASVARRRIQERYEQGFVRKCLYDYYRELL